MCCLFWFSRLSSRSYRFIYFDHFCIILYEYYLFLFHFLSFVPFLLICSANILTLSKWWPLAYLCLTSCEVAMSLVTCTWLDLITKSRWCVTNWWPSHKNSSTPHVTTQDGPRVTTLRHHDVTVPSPVTSRDIFIRGPLRKSRAILVCNDTPARVWKHGCYMETQRSDTHNSCRPKQAKRWSHN